MSLFISLVRSCVINGFMHCNVLLSGVAHTHLPHESEFLTCTQGKDLRDELQFFQGSAFVQSPRGAD